MTQTQAGYDYPEMSWYPRWRCRLTIRFGEFGQLGQLLQLAPTKPARSLSGNNPARNALQVTQDPNNPGQYLLQVQGAGASSNQQTGGQSTVDSLMQTIDGVVPQEFNWSQNGPRTGDSLSITIRFIDCPIDPRTVRSIAVEFYLGTVTAAVAGAQIEGSRSGSQPSTTDAEPADLIPDTYTDSNGNQRTNLRFQGWVDKFKSTWSDGQPVIVLECTDNTRLLLTINAPSKMQISHVLPLDQAIANYLAAFPALQGLSVQYRPVGTVAPVIGAVSTKASIRTGKGPPLANHAPTEKMTVWDLLTDTCRALGHAVFIEGTTIVITRIRSITSANIEPRADDPYVPRTLPSGVVLNNRMMMYGRNVETLDIERDFNVHPPTNVSVRSYDSDTKRVLVERFPLAADAQVYTLPSASTTDQKWVEYEVQGGIKDEATLRAFAQEIYENLGRQELAVSLSTKNFASFGGGNEDPDLLDMKFGDALDILFNREDYYSSLNALQTDLDSVAKNSQYLQAAGFSKKFSDAYAAAYNNAGFTTSFRVHQVGVSGSTDDGVKFDLKLVNYVEVTSDKSLAPGEEPASNPPAQAPALPRLPPPSPAPKPGTGG